MDLVLSLVSLDLDGVVVLGVASVLGVLNFLGVTLFTLLCL